MLRIEHRFVEPGARWPLVLCTPYAFRSMPQETVMTPPHMRRNPLACALTTASVLLALSGTADPARGGHRRHDGIVNLANAERLSDKRHSNGLAEKL